MYARGLVLDVNEQFLLSVRIVPSVTVCVCSRAWPRCQSKNSNAYPMSKNLHGRSTLEDLPEISKNSKACTTLEGLPEMSKNCTLKKRTETSNKKIFYKNQEEVGMTKL